MNKLFMKNFLGIASAFSSLLKTTPTSGQTLQ